MEKKILLEISVMEDNISCDTDCIGNADTEAIFSQSYCKIFQKIRTETDGWLDRCQECIAAEKKYKKEKK